MKYFIFTFILLVFTNISAQRSGEVENWSTSFDLGVASSSGAYTSGYSSSELNNFSTSLGLRYLFDSDRGRYKPYGIRLKGGFTNLTGDNDSRDFETNVYHITLDGVLNIKDLLKLRSPDWPNGFNLFVNLGVGASHYGLGDDAVYSDVNDGYILDGDDLITLNFGITPEYEISRDFSLHIDLTYSLFTNPDFSTDGNSTIESIGLSKGNFGPRMFRASIGVTYYIPFR
jgi:OOP family OmpA-OmpF porin